jgi:hypothetical protein
MLALSMPELIPARFSIIRDGYLESFQHRLAASSAVSIYFNLYYTIKSFSLMSTQSFQRGEHVAILGDVAASELSLSRHFSLLRTPFLIIFSPLGDTFLLSGIQFLQVLSPLKHLFYCKAF